MGPYRRCVADVAPEVVEKDLDYKDANMKSNVSHELDWYYKIVPLPDSEQEFFNLGDVVGA